MKLINDILFLFLQAFYYAGRASGSSQQKQQQQQNGKKNNKKTKNGIIIIFDSWRIADDIFMNRTEVDEESMNHNSYIMML